MTRPHEPEAQLWNPMSRVPVVPVPEAVAPAVASRCVGRLGVTCTAASHRKPSALLSADWSVTE